MTSITACLCCFGSSGSRAQITCESSAEPSRLRNSTQPSSRSQKPDVLVADAKAGVMLVEISISSQDAVAWSNTNENSEEPRSAAEPHSENAFLEASMIFMDPPSQSKAVTP